MPRYIDADAVLDIISNENYPDWQTYSDIFDVIDQAPTADVQKVKHGHWRRSKVEGLPTNRFVCSECDGLVQVSTYRNSCMFKYCPNCGAKMDEKEG